MASLQSSTLLLSSSSSKQINSAIQVPKLPKLRISVPKINPSTKIADELRLNNGFGKRSPLENISINTASIPHDPSAQSQLYAILEAVADRIEIHTNIGHQRDNWNSLLLNSINMITLSATTMAGLAAANAAGVGAPLLAFKLSSTLLFTAATGLSLVMNKIQPSQLAEEQRNATKLFKQLKIQIENKLKLNSPTSEDVKNTMEKVLALDRAYPLPLLGAMLEKFPDAYEPAVWWPRNQFQRENNKPQEPKQQRFGSNGWSEELEVEMREIVELIKRNDLEDYVRLGNLVLKINKILAISGPLLTGIGAISSGLVGNGPWAAGVVVAAGALATVVNAFQHGGQVGMVFEMYRNCGGFFKQMEESIESTLEEKDLEKRENGNVYEMKVALQLGRSLSQLRQLASKSASSRLNGTAMDEFASKLF